MDSTDASRAWAAKYGDLLRRGARSHADALSKLALAERNLERARRALAADDPDGVVIGAEAVIVNAGDAVLARDGLRLRSKTGSHEARAEYPGLPAEFAREIHAMRAVRRARNVALYEHADRVGAAMATEASRIAQMLLAAPTQATG